MKKYFDLTTGKEISEPIKYSEKELLIAYPDAKISIQGNVAIVESVDIDATKLSELVL